MSEDQIQSLIKNRDFSGAEKTIQRALFDHPNDPKYHYFLGIVYHFQGQLGTAIESLKKALALDPKHTDAAICLSVLYNDIGKYDEARAIFQNASKTVAQSQQAKTGEVDKKFSTKHLELGDLYFRYRRFDEAIEEYTKASNLDPLEIDIQIKRAKSYSKKGFVTRAIQELQNLREDHGTNPEIGIQLGLLHFSQGNILDAELEWESVMTVHPDHPKAKELLDMAKSSRLKREESTTRP
jgi:tetratricopeptide (TPR) repeat protein